MLNVNLCLVYLKFIYLCLVFLIKSLNEILKAVRLCNNKVIFLNFQNKL